MIFRVNMNEFAVYIKNKLFPTWCQVGLPLHSSHFHRVYSCLTLTALYAFYHSSGIFNIKHSPYKIRIE